MLKYLILQLKRNIDLKNHDIKFQLSCNDLIRDHKRKQKQFSSGEFRHTVIPVARNVIK